MQLHNVKRLHKNKKSVQVGRGSKRGKTSGRGTKGQNSRSGRKKRPELRDIIKTIPKLRGRGKNINRAFRIKPQVVNVSLLEKHFSSGAEISPAILLDKKLVTRQGGVVPHVKILADGEITKKLIISGCTMSVSAKEKVEKAGGSVK
jgi:large subunit ribosomal protein L15